MEAKKCGRCSLNKLFVDFNINKTKKDGRQIFCRECEKEYKKEWYEKNKESHKKRVGKRNKSIRLENRKRLHEFYLNNPCVDCGEPRPACLDLDHVTGKKKTNVSRMVSSSIQWATIQEEIDKCVVRCANCHRIKTAIERGWYSYVK